MHSCLLPDQETQVSHGKQLSQDNEYRQEVTCPKPIFKGSGYKASPRPAWFVNSVPIASVHVVTTCHVYTFCIATSMCKERRDRKVNHRYIQE